MRKAGLEPAPRKGRRSKRRASTGYATPACRARHEPAKRALGPAFESGGHRARIVRPQPLNLGDDAHGRPRVGPYADRQCSGDDTSRGGCVPKRDPHSGSEQGVTVAGLEPAPTCLGRRCPSSWATRSYAVGPAGYDPATVGVKIRCSTLFIELRSQIPAGRSLPRGRPSAFQVPASKGHNFPADSRSGSTAGSSRDSVARFVASRYKGPRRPTTVSAAGIEPASSTG